MRRFVGAAIGFGALWSGGLVAVNACTPLDASTDTCASVPGCQASGLSNGSSGAGGSSGSGSSGGATDPADGGTPFVIGGNWSCLSSPPAAATPPVPQVTPYAVPIVDFASLRPIPGWSVSVCFAGDFFCSSPFGTVSQAAPDSGMPLMPAFGYLLPTAAEVYLSFSAPSYPTLSYRFGSAMIPPPMPADAGPDAMPPTIVGEAIPPPTNTNLDGLLQQGNEHWDPKAGLSVLVIRVLDCDGKRGGGGIQLRQVVSPGQAQAGHGFALYGDFTPVFSTKAGDLPPLTDGRGVAGYANIPPVNVSVEAILPNDAGILPAKAFALQPNQLTLEDLRPASLTPR